MTLNRASTDPRRGPGTSGVSARRTLSPRTLAWPLILAALFLVVYHTTFAALWRTWMNNPSYSHGVLIPPISAVLVWMRRHELARLPAAPSVLGLPLIGAALLLQLAGLRGDVLIFQGDSLILLLAGFTLHFLGWRWLRTLAFPIAFLVFMVPFLPIFESQVSFRLKQLAASGAVHVSGWLGVLVQRDGMSLYLPGWAGEALATGGPRALRIENACSGMQSLISLMAMGALFAHLARGKAWRRGALFLASIPIALFVNVLRISALCVVGNATSVETASGLFHDVSGFALFGVALVILLGVRRTLRC
jgi:exosortase